MGKFWTRAKDTPCPECGGMFDKQGLVHHRAIKHQVGSSPIRPGSHPREPRAADVPAPTPAPAPAPTPTPAPAKKDTWTLL